MQKHRNPPYIFMQIKNILISCFVKCFKAITPAKRKEKGAADHFLVVSTTALGDTMWATPALKAIKQKHPRCIVSVLTSPVGAQVLASNPFVDQVYILKKPHFFSLAHLYFMLRKKFIDAAFIFHTSQRAVLPFCALLKPNEIIGSRSQCKGLDHLLSISVAPEYEHEIARRLRLIGAKDISCDHPLLEIYLSVSDKQKIQDWKKSKGIAEGKTLIGLHPGSKDKFKRWPIECFAKLGKNLIKQYDCQLIITGGADEKLLLEQLQSLLPGSVALYESFSITELSALIATFDLFITGDTGPMHLSFAVQTRTVALFTATDSMLCGPYKAHNAYFIQKQKTCTPCLRKKCLLPFCMLQIGVQEVEEGAHTLLNKITS